MMTFKVYAFAVVLTFVGLINMGPPLAWAMGGGPIQQPGDTSNIALVKAQPVTESSGNVYIRYRQKVDPYAIYDEITLQAEGMFFVNDTLLEMVREQCPDSNNVENTDFSMHGSVPFQGVDGEYYYYVFSVDHSVLHKHIQAHCTKYR